MELLNLVIYGKTSNFWQPEKKNLGLTPMDSVRSSSLLQSDRLIVSIQNSAWTYEHKYTSQPPRVSLDRLLLLAHLASLKKEDIKVILAILSAVAGYCVKTYLL